MLSIKRAISAASGLALLMTADCPSFAARGQHPSGHRAGAVRTFGQVNHGIGEIDDWNRIHFAGNRNSLRPSVQRFPRPSTPRAYGQRMGGYNGIQTFGNGTNGFSHHVAYPPNPCTPPRLSQGGIQTGSGKPIFENNPSSLWGSVSSTTSGFLTRENSQGGLSTGSKTGKNQKPKLKLKDPSAVQLVQFIGS